MEPGDRLPVSIANDEHHRVGLVDVQVGAFVGTVVQLLGLVTAVVAGIVSTAQSYRACTPAMTR